MNMELRQSLQQAEEKLLECGGVSSNRRRDLVHKYLLQKEEELADAKKESKFLLSELEHLKLLATRRVQAQQHQKQQQQKQGASSVSSAALPNSLRQPTPASGAVAAAARQARYAGQTPQGRYNPSHYKPIVDRPATSTSSHSGGNNKFVMSREEARMVVLSEVRRLHQSLKSLQESRDNLNQKV